jgi:hypothetical protein
VGAAGAVEDELELVPEPVEVLVEEPVEDVDVVEAPAVIVLPRMAPDARPTVISPAEAHILGLVRIC